MLVHFLAFPLFLLAAICMGLSFSIALTRIIRTPDQLELDIGIQGFIGIFAFGILALIFNFFGPLDSIGFFLIVAACTLSGIVILIRNRVRSPIVEIGSLVIVAILLAPFAGSLEPGYDAGLYHLPFQYWLRSEPIVIGLANLHGRFGFGSLQEYVAAPLWLGTQFTLLSYLQASFLVFFLVFMIKQAERARGFQLTLLIAIAINVLIFNSYMSFAYSYTDIPAGLTFAAAFLSGHWLLFQGNHASRWQWAVFSLLCAFAVMLKLSSAVLIFWCVFIVIFRLVQYKDSVHELLLGISVPALLFLAYLFRNVVSTGCLFYPLAASCLDVSWNASVNAQNDANWITAWARHPSAGLYSLEDNSWFLGWWISAYGSFLLNLLKASVGVCAFYMLSALLARTRPIASSDGRFIASFLFMVTALAFWFYQAPNPRFGVGLFVLMVPVVFSFLFDQQHPGTESLVQPGRHVLSALVISIALSIGAPWKLVNSNNLLLFEPLVVPTPAVVSEDAFGVRPKEGDRCWLVAECAPYERPEKSKLYGRTLFESP